jgi:hypothetical protein
MKWNFYWHRKWLHIVDYSVLKVWKVGTHAFLNVQYFFFSHSQLLLYVRYIQMIWCLKLCYRWSRWLTFPGYMIWLLYVSHHSTFLVALQVVCLDTLKMACFSLQEQHVVKFLCLTFDSRHYQIFWVVGLERGPLSLVSTIEELRGRNSSSSGLENQEYIRGIHCADHATPSIHKRLPLTLPTSSGCSVGTVCLWYTHQYVTEMLRPNWREKCVQSCW